MAQKINVKNLPDLNGPLPDQEYKVQVLEVTQEANKKHNCPQDVLTIQIIEPDVVSGVQAAGREGKLYITYSMKNLKNALGTVSRLGIDVPEDIEVPDADEVANGSLTRITDVQDQTLDLVGKQFTIRWGTEVFYETDTGKWDGKPKLDPDTRKPIVRGHKMSMADGQKITSPAVIPS